MWLPPCVALGTRCGGWPLTGVQALKELRLYDTRAQARPVYNLELGEFALKSVAVSPEASEVAAGDVSGGVFLCDLRSGGVRGKFRPMAGSCRAVAFHPTLPLLAACGLDRHVHLYDVGTRKTVHSQYLKQRQNALLFLPDSQLDVPTVEPQPASDGSEDGEDAGHGEDVWATLESAEPKKDKKKKKRKPSAEGGDVWSALDAAAAPAANPSKPRKPKRKKRT